MNASLYKIAVSVLSVFLLFVTTTHAQSVYHTFLSGSQEGPPVTTTAYGEVTVTLDGDELTVTGSFEGLSDDFTGAHIHWAIAGRNGGVEIPLEVTTGEDNRSGVIEVEDNTFDLSEDRDQEELDALVEALEARKLYINVHSGAFPPGEIRGQLLPESDALFRANLSGASEVPPVLTRAHGAIVMEQSGNVLTLTGSYQELSGDFTGAHIHLQYAGRNGGVEIPLNTTPGDDDRSGVFEAEDNTFDLSEDLELDSSEIDELLDALAQRRLYVNVHSSEHPPGEIRGQIVPMGSNTMVANLSGSAEAPPIMSGGSGSIITELNGNQLVVTGSFQDLDGEYTASHLHISLPGRSGGVILGLDATVDTDDPSSGVYEAENNTFALDEMDEEERNELLDLLVNRQLYINVHSDEYPGGEIRGQLLGESYAFFTATFSGIHEIPPVPSPGTGGAEIEFKGNRLVLAGAFDDFTSPITAAHFHIGAPYENGGVILGVNPALDEDSLGGIFEPGDNHFGADDIDEDFINYLFSENLYLNIHSDQFGPGELRGQVLAAPNAWPETSDLEQPEDDALIVIDGHEDQTFEISWSEAEDPDNNTVVYIRQVALNEDFTEHVLSINEGTALSRNVRFGDAMTLLEDNAVDIGETLTLYHRIVTSDGSLYSIGDARSLVLERGELESFPMPPHAVDDILNVNGDFSLNQPAAGVTTEDVIAWTFNITDDAGFDIVDDEAHSGDHSLRIDFGEWDGSGNDWHVEAVNEPVFPAEDDRLRVSVWMKADQNDRVARLYLGLPASGDWARYPDPGMDIELTEDWAEYSFEHDVSADDEEHSMRFAIAMNFEDNDGATIYIDHAQVEKIGEVTFADEMADRPVEFNLRQNYPNPFNPVTAITYELPHAAHVTIDVYNVLGQQVIRLVNDEQSEGVHTVNFDATNFSSGVYIYRMQAGSYVQTRKMMLIK